MAPYRLALGRASSYWGQVEPAKSCGLTHERRCAGLGLPANGHVAEVFAYGTDGPRGRIYIVVPK